MRKLIAWAFIHPLDSSCVTYEAIAGALPPADHPFTGFMNAGRKVVERSPATPVGTRDLALRG
jgi:hypothetical protein